MEKLYFYYYKKTKFFVLGLKKKVIINQTHLSKKSMNRSKGYDRNLKQG